MPTYFCLKTQYGLEVKGLQSSLTMSEPGRKFDWAALVTQVVHPTKVTVIEAMLWIDRPLSATDLAKSFDREFGLSHISYHLKTLAKAGVLKSTGQRQVRGTTETFYFFAGR
jgi:hypothetical protein